MSALNVPKRHVCPVPVLAILKEAALPLDLQNTCVVLVVTVNGPVIKGPLDDDARVSVGKSLKKIVTSASPV
jgi:hypothetical protein